MRVYDVPGTRWSDRRFCTYLEPRKGLSIEIEKTARLVQAGGSACSTMSGQMVAYR